MTYAGKKEFTTEVIEFPASACYNAKDNNITTEAMYPL